METGEKQENLNGPPSGRSAQCGNMQRARLPEPGPAKGGMLLLLQSIKEVFVQGPAPGEKVMAPTAYLETLQRQNRSMRTLISSLEAEVRVLRARDYSHRSEKIYALEQSLESERAMNAVLTEELENAKV